MQLKREINGKRPRTHTYIYQVSVHFWPLINDAFLVVLRALTRTGVATAVVVYCNKYFPTTTPIVSETFAQCNKLPPL